MNINSETIEERYINRNSIGIQLTFATKHLDEGRMYHLPFRKMLFRVSIRGDGGMFTLKMISRPNLSNPI